MTIYYLKKKFIQLLVFAWMFMEYLGYGFSEIVYKDAMEIELIDK